MEIYQGNFENWKDVQEAYGTDAPEPEQVFYAGYETPDYEGYSRILYRNGEKYYAVDGSHCSCYGLEEGGFNPEEYATKQLFIDVLRRKFSSDIDQQVASILEAA